jgi:microcystin-dependent protein
VDNPVTNVPSGSAVAENYAAAGSANASLGGGSASLTAQPAGNGVPFSTMPPYLVLNFCIATQGVYPARN